jgi:hypothetical protein
VRRALVVWCALAAIAAGAQEKPKEPAKPAKISEKTEKSRKLDGFFPLYWDEQAGKVYLEIPQARWGAEFLYTESLAAGIGSNDIGLDRGQLGDARVVKFQRVGPKVLLPEVNYGYRASSDNADERRAVEEAFAQSVIWGFEVAAEEEGRVLVDASSFFVTDAHQTAVRLKAAKQGSYKLDATRSALYLPNTRNFPDNAHVRWRRAR